MSAYLDTSVLVPLLTHDALTSRARAWLGRWAAPIIISDFGAAEFASALGAKLRRGDLDMAQTRHAFALLDAWRVSSAQATAVRSDDVDLAERWLRRLDLTLRTPDALHLAMAARLGAPVATFDAGMAAAAASLGLALAPA